ncbi:putative exporter of the RND superfamily [Cupriavidus necator]|uniref:Predicted exporter of the RND superfamily n=1 Tax=Cupriavidus necator (strain ATCC 17699 / DSM 428 / KCTC 22496 / NCIMB 10442 / H16 / Stanier 337) TaxID=381666 RepID=Q0KDD8_CUPNH|nr:efflux RND transporter permease subunit [Cupriavidus necator]QCB99905.1 RND family transporter [Cupriavidus necator H16]WKA41754.1 efflux RND transporter permease subunit [Cupriavidus necator]CAJ91983.1 predicted exporter of the RND superfamily [Cupriavidus necator H16]
MLSRLITRLEAALFGHRLPFLLALAGFTALMGVLGAKLHLEAGFEKQLPQGHEYIKTFEQFRDKLFGANRLTIAVHARKGDVWNAAALTQVLKVTEAVTYLPGVDRTSVTSLWTPNVFFTEITEDGFRAEAVAGGDIVPEKLSADVIGKMRQRTMAGGHVGTLVARDQSSALITAELADVDPRTGKKLDYIQFNRLLEEKIRRPFENDQVEIEIIGFAKQIGDIADRGADVTRFFGIAFLLTGLAVYWYCRSVRLTLLPLGCSLVSLVWQFGTLHLLGYGLDPLAILVPFLVFAIGVSHGIQQINFIVREVAQGTDSAIAARRSFTGLLIPGSLALITALVSFVTLILIPIPMIRELAITAAIGVGYKIVTNLMMLPVAASYFRFTPEFAKRALARRESHSGWLGAVARIAQPRNALIVTVAGAVVFGLAFWQSQDRHVGSLQAGAPELRADSRYNLDVAAIVSRFDVGLDWLTVVFEATPDRHGEVCSRADEFLFVDDFAWRMGSVPGVVSTDSLAAQLKLYNAGMNEGSPKMATVTRDPRGLGSQFQGVNNRIAGLSSSDCRVQGVNLYLPDHRATTIKTVVAAVKQFRESNRLDGVTVRLASGNAGVQAATNEVLEASELPMMLYVYAAILILVFLVYRDWRAMVACCLPLTVATWIGYWFMKELEIGLTVATLPVMVLAVGIGVDYAFYIYNRLQVQLANGLAFTDALAVALKETGLATVFTAITLSVGVATWMFSSLKFQADMGALLTFMFLVNMVMAITLLPAFAAVLEKFFPRRGPVRMPEILKH